LFQNVLAGHDPRDHVSLFPSLRLPELIPEVAGLRIAVSADLGGWPLDPEVRRNTLALALSLRDQGAVVEEVDLHLPREPVLRAMDIHFKLGFAQWLEPIAARHPDQITDYARDFGARGFTGRGSGTLWDKFELEAALYAPLGDLLSRYDALICATNGTRGLAAGDGYVGHGVEVDGRPQHSYLEALLTPAFNLFSRCPVLAVPSGLADNGVPTGIQIVGRPYDDLTPFRIGAACERARPWLDTPARRPAL
jgi:Asp-tRNA(Asn)/Glu-tRNA(Gln) amidotransferase A subunit family amidase